MGIRGNRGNRGNRGHPRWLNRYFSGAGGTSEVTDDRLCLGLHLNPIFVGQPGQREGGGISTER